jgi:phage-related protein
MYSLTAENTKGEQLKLTGNPAYTIVNIDGLNPPDATINTIQRAGHDGSLFNSSFVNDRQIIIDIAINGDACRNRNELYKFFKTARAVRLIYNNAMVGVYIDGWCQNAPVSFFAQKQIFQVTIICPDPFWHSTAEVEGTPNGIENLFEFPFSIEEGAPIPFSEIHGDNAAYIWNPGTVESGLIIEIRATGAATNPRIYHQNTDAFFRVNTSLQSGDILTIDTRTDHKRITRKRGSSTANLIASRDTGSTWLQMDPGENVYILSAGSGVANLSCIIRSITNIEGV